MPEQVQFGFSPDSLCDPWQVTFLLGPCYIHLDRGMRSLALSVSPGRGRSCENQMRSRLGKCEQEGRSQLGPWGAPLTNSLVSLPRDLATQALPRAPLLLEGGAATVWRACFSRLVLGRLASWDHQLPPLASTASLACCPLSRKSRL